MAPRTWFIDGSNVVGAGADGWWNDRAGAFERFAQVVAGWTNEHEDAVVLVYDGPPSDPTSALAGGNLRIEFAPRRGRDAADDHIVDHVVALLAEDASGPITVVTSDKGLRTRLPDEVALEGAGTFRTRLGLKFQGRR